MIEVLSVASEAYPLVKTGGLADVVGALPAAVAGHDVRMTTMLPGYPAVLRATADAPVAAFFPDFFGGPAQLRRARIGDLDVIAVHAAHLYDRPGNLYSAPDGREWPDNPIRFAALAWAAAEVARGAIPGYSPSVVHSHDWQAGLVPAYLAYAGGVRPRTVMTVHNLAFQGQYPSTLLEALRLPPRAYSTEGVEYYGSIGFLKSGLLFADRLTTVSPRYAAEIRTQEGGMGLDGLMRGRAGDLLGIVNGIDDAEWDPASDPHLAAGYDAASLDRRAANREALEQRFGLDHDDSPLFGVVSRVTWQKGMDLLAEAVPFLVSRGARLGLLGSGEPTLEHAFQGAATQYRGRVGVVTGYDEGLAHRIMGGADSILVPSRFEPCGLTQLYALRYGAIPLVARVGGLSDTIVDANDAGLSAGAATGVQFEPVGRPMLEDAIARTIALYDDRAGWTAMQRRGMGLDLSWRRRAGAYAAMYRSLAAA